MDAISAHLAARTRAAEAILCDSFSDIDLLAKIVKDARDLKNRAMAEYHDHMLSHREEDAGAVSA